MSSTGGICGIDTSGAAITSSQFAVPNDSSDAAVNNSFDTVPLAIPSLRPSVIAAPYASLNEDRPYATT